jgi:hypothetical protein
MVVPGEFQREPAVEAALDEVDSVLNVIAELVRHSGMD